MLAALDAFGLDAVHAVGASFGGALTQTALTQTSTHRLIEQLDAVQAVFGADNAEAAFWACVLRARAGRLDLAAIDAVGRAGPGWRTLYQRLEASGMVPK